MAKARDYTYDTIYESSAAQKRRRAQRNRARLDAIEAGRVKKGSGMDIHHINHSLKGPTKVLDKSRNRSIK